MLQNALMLTDLMRFTAAKSVKNAAKRYTFRFHPRMMTPKRVSSKYKNWLYTFFIMGNVAKRVKPVSINAFRNEYI